MKKIIYDLKTIASMRNQSISELAKDAGLSAYHLYDVSAGRTKMTADDLASISELTEIPMTQIKH